MIDWTRLEQPEIVCNDRPLTGYDDFGNIIFLPVRLRTEADEELPPLCLLPPPRLPFEPASWLN